MILPPDPPREREKYNRRGQRDDDPRPAGEALRRALSGELDGRQHLLLQVERQASDDLKDLLPTPVVCDENRLGVRPVEGPLDFSPDLRRDVADRTVDF